jgi:hypothetical protein
MAAPKSAKSLITITPDGVLPDAIGDVIERR